MASATEKRNLLFYFILINYSLNSHMYLVTTILDSTGIEFARYNMYKKNKV